MAELMAKAKEKTPYVVVAFQECERMNFLMHEIRRSLKELDLGLKVRRRPSLGSRSLGQNIPSLQLHFRPSISPSCGLQLKLPPRVSFKG